MEELLDLGVLKASLSELIAHSNMDDCVLPDKFKAKFRSFGDYKIEQYNLYTLQVSSRKSLLIIPNQWVYIAACCCQYYIELMKYKNKLEALGFTNDMYEACHPSKDNGDISEDQKTKEVCKEKAEHYLENYDGADKEFLVNFLWNYEYWGGGKNIKRSNDFTDSPVLNIANAINASSSLIGAIVKGLANQDCLNLLLESEEWKSFEGSSASSHAPKKTSESKFPLQQIFYGAPGTGKSHAINELTAGKDVIRTTFHPDTDYSTFVGAYKPTTKSVPVTTVIGTNAVPVMYNGKGMMEDKIVYEYVSQAFLQAYVAAWRKYCDVQEGEEPVDEFLVIEEINRGNCAQIFGDLFQLLDRGDEGFSEYPIKADSDMKKLLEKEFEGLEIKNKEGINALFKGGKDIVAEVLAGDVLLLPNNLYIWATMNTSDQSLFPIDSAFKRRWDWNYVPISNAGKNWMIEVNGAQYDWWNFLEAINDKVYHATYSEDKKLGYFFCKAKDGVISADKFVSKVIFYLWNDVFKDSEFEGDTFKDEDGEKLSFDKFYSVENNQVKVNGTKIVKFLSNLNLKPDSVTDEGNGEEGVETEGDKKLPKSPKVFTVEFPDGTVINEKNRFETYLKVLSKIGIEQVEKIAEEMKYQRRNTPLVTKKQHEEILNDAVYSYVQEGDYYIVKGIDAITMYNMVMLLDNRLDLQLKVCYE